MNAEKMKPLEPYVPMETYLEHLITFLKYLRIWRETNTFSRSKLFLLTISIAILFLTNIFLIVSEILMVPGNSDIERISNTINPLGVHVVGFVKWIYCIIKSKDISRLVDDLNRCYLLSKKIDIEKRGCNSSKQEMEIVQKESKMWQYMWTTLCIYGILHWCFNALVQNFNDRAKVFDTNNSNAVVLPYIGRQPWSIDNVMGYTCSYTIQLVGALTSNVGTACYDSLHISILMVIFGQLRCLYLSLMDTIDGSRTIEEFEIKLRCCIDHHAAVLKISQRLESFGILPMFFQCIENIIIICLLTFEITVMQFKMDVVFMTKFVSIMEYFSALSVQLYVFCFYSDRISSMSLKIADAVYACDWERTIYDNTENTRERRKLSMKVKHLLLLLLLRAQKPIIMTGGPFYVLSLETFKSITSIAISNAVILRQFTNN